MSVNSKRRNIRIAVVVGLVLLALLALWALTRGGEKVTEAGPYVPPSTTLEPMPTTLSPSPGAGGSLTPPTFPTEGMGSDGDGYVKEGGAHKVVITVTSDVPMVWAGHKVPTAKGNGQGESSAVKTYARTVTAYGYPDFAQVMAIAGKDSASVRCTITVDGKVTSSKSARGSWALVFCQG